MVIPPAKPPSVQADAIRNRLLGLHLSTDEQRLKAECVARTFTRTHADNETFSAEELKSQEETKQTLRHRDALPFGAHIKKAAFQAADIGEKSRQVLERYQRQRSESICLEDLDDLLSDELNSNGSVSSDSSEDDLDLELDLDAVQISSAKPISKGDDSIEKVATGIDL